MYSLTLLAFIFSGVLAFVPSTPDNHFRFRGKMNASPTFVLVPGAFHLQSAMDILGLQLKNLGYQSQSFGLPTVNNPKLSVTNDAIALEREVLHPLIELQNKDVVVYLHSYAGFPGSVAIKGYSKTERQAAGKRGGIIGLIYQSAFIPLQGDTLLKMIGGQYAPWQDPNTQTGLITVIDPKKTFYADVVEPLATKASSLIRPQSLLSFNTPSGPTYYGIAAYDKRRVYLHTNQDQALPPFAQDAYLAGSGTEWTVQRLDTSHSPFFSEPQKLAELVIKYAQDFSATF